MAQEIGPQDGPRDPGQEERPGAGEVADHELHRLGTECLDGGTVGSREDGCRHCARLRFHLQDRENTDLHSGVHQVINAAPRINECEQMLG